MAWCNGAIVNLALISSFDVCSFIQIWDVLLPENQSAEKTEREEGDEEGDEIVAGRLPSGGGAVSDDVTFGPAHFVGSISNILSKFPDGLQINRVRGQIHCETSEKGPSE